MDTQTVNFRRVKNVTILSRLLYAGTDHAHLLDCGSDIELASKEYVARMNWRTYEGTGIRLRYMDGSLSETFTKRVKLRWSMGPMGDRRHVTVEYVVAAISEELVLGYGWLEQVNPIIDWQKRTWAWRDPLPPDEQRIQATITTLSARAAREPEEVGAARARRRIIQGEIQANEMPGWVRKEFHNVIVTRPPGELPPYRPGFDYKFELKPGWRPRREPPRRFSPEEQRMFQELAEKETNQWKGWRWEFSKSPQAVQMLWAAKAGGQKRPCTDYRPLNHWIKDDQEPLPSIELMISRLSGKRVLSSWDIPEAYKEIRIADGGFQTNDGFITYREALAFQCNNEIYEPAVMQFGTKTAVQHFQRYMQHVLRPLLGKGLEVYLDNIAMGAETDEELEKIERAALKLLADNHLAIKPEKCEWHKHEIMFMGFLIGNGKIRMDPEKLRAIREWTIPWHDDIPEGEKKAAIREFVGFCVFYRTHVPRFSDMAGPLTAIMHPHSEWRSGEREKEAFEALKNAVCDDIERVAFNEKAEKVAHTDAATYGAASGAVSQRGANGELQALGFWSKKFSETERRWGVTEQELFAIFGTFKAFRYWLHGAPGKVQVYSDHSALKTLSGDPETNTPPTLKMTPKIARWVMALEEFNFIIKHIEGRRNRAADALSRVGTHGHGKWEQEFHRKDWLAPSGVAPNRKYGLTHAQLLREEIEPIAAKDSRVREAWEKHKRMGRPQDLERLLSLLILSSSVHSS